MNTLFKLAIVLAITLLCLSLQTQASPMKKLRLAVDAAVEEPRLVKPIILLESSSDSDSESELDSNSEIEVDMDSETEADTETEVETQDQTEVDADADSEAETETETELEAEGEEPVLLLTSEEIAEAKFHSTPIALLETSAATETEKAGAKGASGGDSNPTYVLPYPPLMPHFFTPFLNPYSNVNPLSFPYNYYYGQNGQNRPPMPQGPAPAAPGFAGPGAYAGFGAAAPYGGPAGPAAGGQPYYPYYAFLERRTHMPWQLRTVGVGENQGSEFPQFLETETTVQTEKSNTACVGCDYN